MTETKALRQGGGKSLILNAALNRCCSELFPLAVLKALPTWLQSDPARNGKQSLSSASPSLLIAGSCKRQCRRKEGSELPHSPQPAEVAIGKVNPVRKQQEKLLFSYF